MFLEECAFDECTCHKISEGKIPCRAMLNRGLRCFCGLEGRFEFVDDIIFGGCSNDSVEDLSIFNDDHGRDGAYSIF